MKKVIAASILALFGIVSVSSANAAIFPMKHHHHKHHHHKHHHHMF